MSKNVQMSIKMDSELHDQFMALANIVDMPAAQIVRQLMRKFIAFHENPNQTTIVAMQAADKDEGLRFSTAGDLFKDLGI